MVLVKEIMSKSPYVLRADATLLDACKMMKEQDTGFLPVSQDGTSTHIIGVITDRDMCIRAGAAGESFKNAKVSAYMSKDIHFLFQEDNVNRAAQMMKECKCRRVLICESEQNKKLVGVLSLGDLSVHHQNDKLILETLKEIYHAKPTPA